MDSPAWRGVEHQHRQILLMVLDRHPHARSAWAARLGIERQTLDDLIKEGRIYDADLGLLPSEVAAEYHRALADLHEGAGVAGVTKLQAVTDAHRECAEAVGVCLQATGRGSSVSREEQLRELREAESALARLRAAVEAQP